jgi:hypothetical protein
MANACTIKNAERVIYILYGCIYSLFPGFLRRRDSESYGLGSSRLAPLIISWHEGDVDSLVPHTTTRIERMKFALDLSKYDVSVQVVCVALVLSGHWLNR